MPPRPNTANKIRLFVKPPEISTFPVKAFWPSFAHHSSDDEAFELDDAVGGLPARAPSPAAVAAAAGTQSPPSAVGTPSAAPAQAQGSGDGGAGEDEGGGTGSDGAGDYGSARSGWLRRTQHAPPTFAADPTVQYSLYVHGKVVRAPAGTAPPPHVAAATCERGRSSQNCGKFLGSNPGPAAAGWALFAEGSASAVLEGFGALGNWSTRSAAAFTALLCGLEDAHAAGVRRLKVYTSSALVLKNLPVRFRAASAGRVGASSLTWLRGLPTAIVTELDGFDSVTVAKTPSDNDGGRTAVMLADFGIDSSPPGGEAPNTTGAPDRVLLTYLRHIVEAATSGSNQDAYRAYAAAELRSARAGPAGVAAPGAVDGPSDGEDGDGSADEDSGSDGGASGDLDWAFVSGLVDRHLDDADQFNLNTNVRHVLESLPGKTSDVFGKCINVCAVAISDSDPERRLLGWSLLQILPRLVLTPTGYGWHSSDSGRVVRRRCARFLDGEWRALYDESSRHAESSRSEPFVAELADAMRHPGNFLPLASGGATRRKGRRPKRRREGRPHPCFRSYMWFFLKGYTGQHSNLLTLPAVLLCAP